MASTDKIEAFVVSLRGSPQNSAVFNPWWEVDLENDRSDEAPRIRRQQLKSYLAGRLAKAKLVLIGEALGYRGGHFTGIPMTSERILLGSLCKQGIAPEDVLPSMTPRRTSKSTVIKDGFTEPTATIVWSMMQRLDYQPREFVLWNAFPWHPFDKRKGMLSNRRPTPSELESCLDILREFLRLFPGDRIIALGRIAGNQLAQLGCERLEVRHPASGGAREFCREIAKLV